MRRETIPPMCTTITPAVPGVRLRSTSSGRMANDTGSISTSTGRAPACKTAAAVAKNVLVGTRTSLPSTPNARRMISRELVPLLTAIARRAPQNLANCCSNSAPYLPNVNCPVASTSWMRSAIQIRSSGRNWIFAAGTRLLGAMSCFTLSKVSSFPSALWARDLRERHQPHAQTDEHRPRPAMHGDRFLQDELGSKGAKDIDQRGCGKHNTEVGPGQDRKKPDEVRSEEHTSELQSRLHLVCRLLLEKKKNMNNT